MISLLQRIVEQFICWVQTGVVLFFNMLIAAVGAVIEGLLVLLPPMPELPAIPDEVLSAFAFGKYWFPIDYFDTLLALALSLWAAWFVVSIALRWARATSE